MEVDDDWGGKEMQGSGIETDWKLLEAELFRALFWVSGMHI
jgi:hypothetical protein